MGQFEGTTVGAITINLDERLSYYEGVAYLHPGNTQVPGIAASFRTPNKNSSFSTRTYAILPIHPSDGIPVSWDLIKGNYPVGTAISLWADVKGSFSDGCLNLSWRTDLGVEGRCALTRLAPDRPSELKPLRKNWREYQDYVAELETKKYLFRGQNEPWRLRTSFHRAERANISRFLFEDIPELHRSLSSRTKHLFNLGIAQENGGFYNLIQHHGYPTPILDWTYSPYVAAFFAYRGMSNEEAEARPTKPVRILVFDQAQWKLDWNQLLFLAPATSHFSVAEFIAIENERMIPQQAASTVTNIDDIEDYIRARETAGKSYLWAIDLPAGERRKIVTELGYMGITAGSLFPGLDGMCEALKERNFGAGT
jgi:hypothetical protein